MKVLCLLLTCFCLVPVKAQLLFSGQIKNAQPGKALVVNVPFDAWYHKSNSVEVQLDANGRFSVSLAVMRPQTIFLDYGTQRLYLYAQPNSDLQVLFDAKSFPQSIRFAGKLKKENTFRKEAGLLEYSLGKKDWNDTLSSPQAILESVAQNQQAALGALKAQQKHFPQDFVQMTEADIRYFAPALVWKLAFANNVWGRKNLSRHGQDQWRAALKATHLAQPLSNAQAVPSYFYQEMLAYYPRYLQLSSTKEEFSQLVEQMFQKPFAEAKKEIKEKGERFWKHQALVYGLNGLALESALASFLDNGIQQGDLGWQQEAYDDFLVRYPKSHYQPYLAHLMQRYWQSHSKARAHLIEFVPSTEGFQTLEDILQAHRGRVVYVDLWGSWCGPCRDEFAYTKALKERFKSKEVDFLYIAFERSAQPQKTWQETVQFYGLSGRHVLGTKTLEAYFQKLYAQDGAMLFPSYLLIDKAGNLVTLHAPRPSNPEALYQQIEKLL